MELFALLILGLGALIGLYFGVMVLFGLASLAWFILKGVFFIVSSLLAFLVTVGLIAWVLVFVWDKIHHA